ncbi:MAG: asparagine synthase (glutamine-hydrolyzing) [Kangiellaceae bacterium]|nr:asparagine synthase (glutamine-hydrolyzing) [Kangiellaceae bacterium]|tara:strand:+ start:702 stop:2597 length:1896 start_codon:yes stop_codon:yes gene_type:complete
MCGIAGIVCPHNNISQTELQKMIDSFHYRGPNDDGLWVSPGAHVGLAHKRLSILDPTPAGHQPMVDPDTGNVIAYNGEVYNYIEVREGLKQKGVQFTTGTDTEVILKAYAVYGEDCISHFNGMFAFALWDVSKQQLFVVRDRLGIKPLYYYRTPEGRLLFASEVKAIHALVNRSWTADLRLVDEYMSFGYVPGEDTLQPGIKRLMPGHCAVYRQGEWKVRQYWDLYFDNAIDHGLEYYRSSTLDLLNSAIDLRLRSDVPLGIFLSGGLDSSTVVGLLAQRSETALKTFSVAYDFGPEFDESEHARLVSRHFGTEHHEIKVDPKDFEAFIPKYIHLMDEPVTEAAAISLQYVSQLASDHVTVVLSGEGADELFGGYDFYRYMTAIERYRQMLGGGMSSLLGRLGSKALGFHDKLVKYCSLAAMPIEQRYRGISSYGQSYRDLLYRSQVKAQLQALSDHPVEQFIQGLFAHTKGKDPLSRMLYFDTKSWLVDDLLIKADRMSMASSLELRVPFLDYRLVEHAAKMPSHYKVRDGVPKFILKQMVKDVVPSSIIQRKKMGFPTPLKMMFQNQLSDYVRHTLLSSGAKIHSLVDDKKVASLLDAHYADRADHHRALWQLIVLEEWLKHNNTEIAV